jgi:transposase
VHLRRRCRCLMVSVRRCGDWLGRSRQVLQARALLLAGDGVANAVIADEVGVTAVTVQSWRARFAAEGLAGLS